MVKNSGGKHGKKIARKNAHSNSENSYNRRIRLAQGDEELYGIVTKCLGNGQFLIVCIDQVERLCVLRNKFTGRNKQSNLISIGSWVIVGLRKWETTKPNKKEKCDMIEIYTNTEKHKLLEECKVNLTFLTQQESILLNIEENDDDGSEYITFSEGIEKEGVGSEPVESKNIVDKESGNDDINMDDSNFDDEIDIDEI